MLPLSASQGRSESSMTALFMQSQDKQALLAMAKKREKSSLNMITSLTKGWAGLTVVPQTSPGQYI